MSDKKKSAWNGPLISRRRMLHYGLVGMAGFAGGFWPVSAFGETNVMSGVQTDGISKQIKSIHIGVVKNIEIHKSMYSITLDNGVQSNIPADHPIRNTYINNEIRFPHFNNDAIALVLYDNDMKDWLPARIAVVGDAGVIAIGNNKYKFSELTYEQCLELTSQAQSKRASVHYGMLSILPVPSFYRLSFNEQFSEHNFNLIKEMLTEQGKNIHIDFAYSYSKKIGYSIVYAQPTRFTLQYCKDAGIRTN